MCKFGWYMSIIGNPLMHAGAYLSGVYGGRRELDARKRWFSSLLYIVSLWLHIVTHKDIICASETAARSMQFSLFGRLRQLRAGISIK